MQLSSFILSQIVILLIPINNWAQDHFVGAESIVGQVKSSKIHYYDVVTETGDELVFGNKDNVVAYHVASETIINYDDEGKILKQKKFNHKGEWLYRSVYTYDEAGNKTSVTEWNSKDSTPQKITYQNRYDAQNRLIEVKEIQDDGTMNNRIEMVYSSDGKVIETRKYKYTYGKEMYFVYHHQYNDKGLESEEKKTTHQGLFKMSRRFQYDEHGNVIKEIRMENNKLETWFYEYVYDSRNNWTKKIVYQKTGSDKKPVSVTTRTIKYD